VAPVIIATDKTQLTKFSASKSAYPVYLTLGNIPRAIRRKPGQHACVLIGYLSVDKVLKEELSAREVSSRVQRLFHDSLRIILEPLKKAGEIGIEIVGGDGLVRLVFPILACYVADYPEQCLVTCTKYGTCPKCRARADELAEIQRFSSRTQAWTASVINEANLTTKTNSSFRKQCMSKDVSGGVFEPFWLGFPHCDIHMAITSDILHQLYQGVFKHIIEWCQELIDEEELDQRLRTLPPCYGVRHFHKGWASLGQIGGKERKHMARVLLACLVGKVPRGVILAYRALLDFIYLAQYPTHDDDTLFYMQKALQDFHRHKEVIINLGIRDDLDIPKFHSLQHYMENIRNFGTTDNYNTEMFERFHIDFCKEGWYASNGRNEKPQMISWLTRREKVASFQSYIKMTMEEEEDEFSHSRFRDQRIVLTKRPHQLRRHIMDVIQDHTSKGFQMELISYLNTHLPHPHPRTALHTMDLPFSHIDIYHGFKFCLDSLGNDVDFDQEEADTVKAKPSMNGKPARFDTVVVMNTPDCESTGLEGK
jgi:hypothetical protein